MAHHQVVIKNACAINTTHCEQCGSTSYEDVDPFENDGYSSCCNELIVHRAGECRGHHVH